MTASSMTSQATSATKTQTQKTAATHSLSTQISFQNLSKMIGDLLIVLSPKEKYIIEHRFGISGYKHETLEKIGKFYKITRERVRQIESNALKKLQRTTVNTNIKIINEYGKMLIEKHGGVILEEKLIQDIGNAIQSNFKEDAPYIQLSLTLDKDISKTFNTINYRPYWRKKEITHKQVEEIAHKTINIIKNKQNVTSPEELLSETKTKTDGWPNQETYKSLLQVDKRIKITNEGLIGLTEWRHINPRTIRDKIHFVLSKKAQPMHFAEIAESIIQNKFDHKKVNVQAVHNELIRNTQFVLIGRGIYALQNWGYKKGTVSNVIEEVLNDGKPHSQEEIIEKVLSQRKIKKITILLNLKNKKKFNRIGRYTYQLAKK